MKCYCCFGCLSKCCLIGLIGAIIFLSIYTVIAFTKGTNENNITNTKIEFLHIRTIPNTSILATGKNCKYFNSSCEYICENLSEENFAEVINALDCSRQINLTLQQMEFKDNKIKTDWAKDLNNTIEILTFKYSQFETIELNAFSNSEFLGITQLTIAFAKLTMLKRDTFFDLKQLKELSIRDNNDILDVEENCLSGLENLQILQIQADISEASTIHKLIGNKSNVYLPKVLTLDLSFNALSVLEPKMFSKVTNVVQIFLFNNNIKHIESGVFTNLARSDLLVHLHQNLLTYIEPEVFNNNFNDNKKVSLELNPWNCSICELEYLKDKISAGNVTDEPMCADTSEPIKTFDFCAEVPEVCNNNIDQTKIDFHLELLPNNSIAVNIIDGKNYDLHLSWKNGANDDCYTTETRQNKDVYILNDLIEGHSYIICLTQSETDLSLINCRSKTIKTIENELYDEFWDYFVWVVAALIACVILSGFLTFLYMYYVHAPKREERVLIEKTKRDALVQHEIQQVPLPKPRWMPPIPESEYFQTSVSGYERPIGEPFYERIRHNRGLGRIHNVSEYEGSTTSYIYPPKLNKPWNVEESNVDYNRRLRYAPEPRQRIDKDNEDIYATIGSSTTA